MFILFNFTIYPVVISLSTAQGGGVGVGDGGVVLCCFVLLHI
jgi:hypothetical protein